MQRISIWGWLTMFVETWCISEVLIWITESTTLFALLKTWQILLRRWPNWFGKRSVRFLNDIDRRESTICSAVIYRFRTNEIAEKVLRTGNQYRAPDRPWKSARSASMAGSDCGWFIWTVPGRAVTANNGARASLVGRITQNLKR